MDPAPCHLFTEPRPQGAVEDFGVTSTRRIANPPQVANLPHMKELI